MLIDAPVLSEPRAWEVSKVNRLSYNGLVLVTLAQNKFNQFTDYIDIDAKGNVIGLWADYHQTPITPVDSNPNAEPLSPTISFAGLKPEIKIGGGYKKYTAVFESEALHDYEWSFLIDGEDANDVVTVLTPDMSTDLESDQIKVKFIGGNDYLGKVLTIKIASDIFESTLDVSIIAL